MTAREAWFEVLAEHRRTHGLGDGVAEAVLFIRWNRARIEAERVRELVQQELFA